MKEAFRKLIFYAFFIALGTTCAEVLSTNSIGALWSPIGFLPYGLLYIFFLDYLLKKKVSDWKTIYLFGCLVGFITEAYFAKVVFFGWPESNFIFHGFAIKEIFILIFFFHPIFSFMLPVFIAKNFFNFPFAIKESKHKWIIFLLPIYPLMMSITKKLNFSLSLITTTLISLGIIVAAILLLYYLGKIKNVILSKKAKIFWILFFFVFYTIAFFKAPIYGRDYVIIPGIIPIIISFIFVAFSFSLIYLRTRNLKKIKSFEYKGFKLKRILLYLVYLYVVLMSLLFVISPFGDLRMSVLAIILLLGTILGTVFFIYVLIESLRMIKSKFKNNLFLIKI